MRKSLGLTYIIFGLLGFGLDFLILTAFMGGGNDPIGAFLFMLVIAAPITGPIAIGSLWLIGIGAASIASTKVWPDR